MKCFLVFLLTAFCAHAQNQTYKASSEVALPIGNAMLSVDFDFQIGNLTQEHFSLEKFDSPTFPWQEFFDYSFGTKMDSFQEDFLDDVASDIYDFAVKSNYTSEQLFSLILSFTNSLSSIQPSALRDEVSYYYPYEIFMVGAQNDIDKMSVFSALASSFCYDLTFGVFDGKFASSVLVTRNGDFFYRDNDYKSLKQTLGSDLIQVFGFTERCKYQSLRNNPIDPEYVIPFDSIEDLVSFDALGIHRSHKPDSENGAERIYMSAFPIQQPRRRLSQNVTINSSYVVFSNDGRLQALPAL